MSAEAFKTGAVFDLIDHVTPGLRRLYEGFDQFDIRITRTQTKLDELGLGAVVTKMNAEWREISLLADAGVGSIVKKFGALGPETAPMFGEIGKGATTSFSRIADAAGAMSTDVIGSTKGLKDGMLEQLGLAGTEGAKLFEPITVAAKDASASAIASIGGVTTAIETAVARLGVLTSEVNKLGARATAIDAGGVVAATEGSAVASMGRGHRRGLHFGRAGTEIPGGHVSTGGTPALAAAGIVGFGLWEAMQAEDVIAKAGITGQLDMGGDFQNGPQAQAMRDMMKKTASTTGFSLKDSGEAILGVERMMGGLDFDTRLRTMQTLLPIAGAEARLKETTLEESFKALVGIAHMTGTYDPKQLQNLAKQFSFASLVTDASLPQMEKTLSYSLPILHAGLDMDPRSVMMLTTMAQNAGITSTKSGTWLRSFFENSEPMIGSSKLAKAHNASLRRLGMLDADDHVTWRKTGADGKIDWTDSVINLAQNLGPRLHQIPIDERLGTIKNVWGERGGGFAALMGLNTFIEQMPIIADKMKNYKGGEQALEEYSRNSPLQQARETWRDFENILLDLGQTVLPPVNAALRDIDTVLRALPKNWEDTKKLWSGRAENAAQILTGNRAPLTAAGAALPDLATQKGWDLATGKVNAAIWGWITKNLNPVGSAHGAELPSAFHPDTAREGTDRGYVRPLGGASGSWGALNTGVVPVSLTSVTSALPVTLASGAAGMSSIEQAVERGAWLGVMMGLKNLPGIADLGSSGGGIINASYGGGGFGGGAARAARNMRYGPTGHSRAGGANPYSGGAGAGSFVPPIGDHLTAGMRNNNLGNIGFFGQHTPGLIGPSNSRDVDHSIAKFATQEDGIRAAASLALAKFHKGRHTTWDIIAAPGGWTPGALGPGASVNVARAMGLTNRSDLNLDDPGQMVKFLHGLAIQEHGAAGRFYSEDRIRGALGRPHAAIPSSSPPPTVSAPPPRRVSPGKPAGQIEAMNLPPIHLTVHHTNVMDGKVMSRGVSKHIVADNMHHRSVGAADGYGSHQPPGADVIDTA